MNVALRLRTYPQIGRVSNLPTIATQAAAAFAIAAVAVPLVEVALVAAALAAAYVAGMFLNDAYDRDIDARQRPDRPIPAGLVDAREVFAVGAGLLVLGVALLVLVGMRRGHTGDAVVGSLALGAAILVYDAWHKGNPIAPLLMGLCRALVYVAVGLALSGSVSSLAAFGAAAMLAYVAGLSEVSRSERAPWHAMVLLGAAPIVLLIGCVRAPVAIAITCALAGIVVMAIRRSRAGEPERATVLLLAGLSFVDASLLAAHGDLILAGLAIVAMPLTRSLQRFVRGT
jgi:4-hydroxybenzoate polyprenyltransferase